MDLRMFRDMAHRFRRREKAPVADSEIGERLQFEFPDWRVFVETADDGQITRTLACAIRPLTSLAAQKGPDSLIDEDEPMGLLRIFSNAPQHGCPCMESTELSDGDYGVRICMIGPLSELDLFCLRQAECLFDKQGFALVELDEE